MTVFESMIRKVLVRRPKHTRANIATQSPPIRHGSDAAVTPPVDIAADDPIISYFQRAPTVVELSAVDVDSPALAEMRQRGVTLVVPLVANGELIGLLSVGRRLSEQDYSADDRRLLEALAARAAPAVRVGQLVREQQTEIQLRGRLEQELAVARLIQQNFLPKELPQLSGWQVAVHYRPARAVGGDFYDFIELSDDRIGLVIGDVTDKGVPAAMVMAATRSLLRASAQRSADPGAVLAAVNDDLCPDIPENMFVTCFYGVLDPASGQLRYANAGHNLPLVRSDTEKSELRATGMPLGLMPAMQYEQREAILDPGVDVLFYSDGLVEAHDPTREMFGIQRVGDVLARALDPQPLIDALVFALDAFIGSEHEQEDDITLVVVRREKDAADAGGQILADFAVASAPGNERAAIQRVAEALAPFAFPTNRLEQLKTATAEAIMNAMEHGNGYEPKLDVRVVVAASDSQLTIRITDHAADRQIPAAQMPDLDAMLQGRESPRGWGLFLIERLVDGLGHECDATHHTVELQMRLKRDEDATE